MNRLLESIKLRHRANKYKNNDDKGGISYILSTVKKGHTVFDIGAHKAGYLYFMQKLVGDNGHVFAFEPQLRLFTYIQKIKDLYKWENVTVDRSALSDRIERVTLYIPGNNVTKGSSPGATIVENEHRSDEIVTTENIATETLDNYCSRNKIQPGFLKIDVEGNELRVFKGAIETLKKYRPKILVEIEARHVGEEKARETFNFMASLGYTGYFIHGLDRTPLSAFSFEKYQNTSDMNNYCNNFIFE